MVFRDPIKMQHVRPHFRTKPLSVRFWERVDKSAGPDGCWPWTGGKENRKGMQPYGITRIHKTKLVYAHRLAWMLHNNIFLTSRDDCVLHTCDNPPCCNPKHLFRGTREDNIKDMDKKGRRGDCRGIKNSSAKLSENDVWNIRRLRKKGMSLPKIAKIFGVHFGTIHKIDIGKTWKHIK